MKYLLSFHKTNFLQVEVRQQWPQVKSQGPSHLSPSATFMESLEWGTVKGYICCIRFSWMQTPRRRPRCRWFVWSWSQEAEVRKQRKEKKEGSYCKRMQSWLLLCLKCFNSPEKLTRIVCQKMGEKIFFHHLWGFLGWQPPMPALLAPLHFQAAGLQWGNALLQLLSSPWA